MTIWPKHVRRVAALLPALTLASIMIQTSAYADVTTTVTLPLKVPSLQVNLFREKLFTPSLRNVTLTVSVAESVSAPVATLADPAACSPGFVPLIGLGLSGGEASVGRATVAVSGDTRDANGNPTTFQQSLTSSPNQTLGPIGPGRLLDICVEGSSPASVTSVAHNGSGFECSGVLTTVQVGDLALYVDDRSQSRFVPWLYAETNGQPGLQRGGTRPFGDSEPCPESSSTPDRLIY